ncbi:MAG: carboxypeptidase-like regulatory domain-containing protein, partial [Myxococcota bacterium]|nr:carboxypeptidase-like regulatory domain-containing protein [Myxococcota bacterium]
MRAFLACLVIAFTCACSEYELRETPKDNAGADDTATPVDTADPEETGEPGSESSVSGQICDPSGAGWVVDAYVYISVDLNGDGVEDERYDTYTDVNGEFTLEGMPPGDYTVYVEKGSFSTDFDVSLPEGHTDLAVEECLDSSSVNIAVVTGAYDSIENILDDLDLEYDKFQGTYGTAFLTLLRDPDLMAEYDIIFFNCGISDYAWLSYSDEIGTNISDFVEAGGSIYASDWAYYFFESAFPDAVTFYGADGTYGSAQVGESGEIIADVIDTTLITLLGDATAQLNYDLSAWVVAESVKSNVDVLLQG